MSEEKTEIPRLSDEELKQFVRDFCDGRVFSSAHLADAEVKLEQVFLPIAFGAIHPDQFDSVGLIYEYIDKSGHWSINGCPTFLSLRVLHSKDWLRAHEAIKKELRRRSEIEV